VKLKDQVISWLARQDAEVYLVGGCVRDQLLGRRINDLDVSVDADGLALARKLADRFEGDYFPLDVDRSVGRAILRCQDGQRLYVDIARFRGDGLAADLAGRDFTINALAIDVHSPDVFIDLHGGLADLEAGLVQVVSEWAIRSDPVRALRAVRHAAQLGFELAPNTADLIARDGAAIAGVAAERVCDELSKLLACAVSAPYLEMLDRLDLLAVTLPELEPLRDLEQPPPHRYPALRHTLETVHALELLLGTIECASSGGSALEVQVASRGLYLGGLLDHAAQLHSHMAHVLAGERPRLVTLKMAALLHDVAKPATRSEENGRIRFLGHDKRGSGMARAALERLRFSSTEARLAETIVQNHMRPLLLANQESVSARSIYRFFRDTQDAGIDIVLHALADHLATYAFETEEGSWHKLVDLAQQMLAYVLQREDRQVTQPPLVNGRDLLRDFGLQPGPQIGILLEAVREAQSVGEIGTRDEAIALVGKLLEA
jgi:putative nucleotidyltransferase with HDIG domain